MFYSVYILLCKDKKLYVGQTNNLEKRMGRHAAGLIAATKLRRPVVCIHSEDFETRKDAMKRELFLKSLWGSREKKQILKKYLDAFSA